MDMRFLRMIEEVEDYAILLLDQDGIIQSWNKGAEKIKQYTAEEAIGRSFSVFYMQRDRDDHLPERLLQMAARDGKVTHAGWRVKKDQSQFWGHVTITALHDDDGLIIGYAKVTKDLTVVKKDEDRLKALTEELQQQNIELAEREQRIHRMILEVEDYALILLDNQGIVLDWNRGAEKLKQYSRDEIIGQHFSKFYLDEDRIQGLPEQLLSLARGEGKASHEGWRIRKDGTRFWGSVSITALHNTNGAIIGFSKVTRDLTDRKIAFDSLQKTADELLESNQQLQESEERYARMIGEVQDYAIILLDINGNILNWNKGAQHIKGYHADEILGKSFKMFYTLEDLEQNLPDRLLAKALRDGTAVQEGWRLRKDRSRFWGSITITAVHNAREQVIGFSKVTKDLTSKKIAEDNLSLTNQELTRQNHELEQFAYVASHDLQEPLRKIRTFSDLVSKSLLSPQLASTYLDKINQSALRMSDLIQSILTYSKLSSGSEGFQQVRLDSIVTDVMQDYELVLADKKAEISYNDLPIITALPSQITQLFSNLIANALKYCDVRPVIKIESKIVLYDDIPNRPSGLSNQSYSEISIHDNGIGFDEQYLNKIFGLFQRLHPKHVYQGTGIGLALCKRIMENHRGFITAQSAPGKGSTFFVYFPGKV